jgi:hypothetical protein
MQLVRKIKGEVLGYTTGSAVYFTKIAGEIQQGDYVNLHGYSALMQDLTKTDYTQSLVTPLVFGLMNPHNIPMVTLQIDY